MGRKLSPTVKCRWAKCRYDNKDIPREEAIHLGNAFYHPQCIKEKESIQRIIDLFLEYKPNVIASQLRKIVNDIIYKNGVDISFLEFAVEYSLKNKMLNHPPGLFYIVNNKKINDLYKKKREAEIRREYEASTSSIDDDMEDDLPKITYTKKKNTGFSSILN